MRAWTSRLLLREEVSQALLAILDLNENVKRIRWMLEEDDDGEDPDEAP